MIKEITAIEMVLDQLDRSDKFNAEVYEKARDEFIDMRAEISQLREDLEQAESLVEELTDKVAEAKDVLS